MWRRKPQASKIHGNISGPHPSTGCVNWRADGPRVEFKNRYFPKPLSGVSILWTSFIWNFNDTVKKGYSSYTSYLSVTRIKLLIIVNCVAFPILHFFSSLIDFHEMVHIEKLQIFNIRNSCWVIHPESASKVYIPTAIDSISLQTQSIISVWPRMDWYFWWSKTELFAANEHEYKVEQVSWTSERNLTAPGILAQEFNARLSASEKGCDSKTELLPRQRVLRITTWGSVVCLRKGRLLNCNFLLLLMCFFLCLYCWGPLNNSRWEECSPSPPL